LNLPSVTIDSARRVVILRFVGVVTLETFVEGREAIQREPGWSPRLAHVFDFTGVTDLAISTQAIRQLASAPPVFDRSLPQILVAQRGSFEYGIATMFGALASDQRNVHVVESMDAAWAILAASGFTRA